MGSTPDRMLTHLIRYLRHAMPRMRMPMSTLGQEFELVDAYLQIACIRMGGRLTVAVDIPQFLRGTPFPPLIVQTLVENALKHGVELKTGPVAIRVFATKTNGSIQVTVSDTGVGLEHAATPGSGTGLANTRARLKAIYDGKAQLLIATLPGGGVQALVTIEETELDESKK